MTWFIAYCTRAVNKWHVRAVAPTIQLRAARFGPFARTAARAFCGPKGASGNEPRTTPWESLQCHPDRVAMTEEGFTQHQSLSDR